MKNIHKKIHFVRMFSFLMIVFYIEVALLVFFSFHSVFFLVWIIMFTIAIPDTFHVILVLSLVRYTSSLKDRNQRNIFWEKFFLVHRREVANFWFRFWFNRKIQLTSKEKEFFLPMLRLKPSFKKDMEDLKTLSLWAIPLLISGLLSLKTINLPDQIFFYAFSLSSLLLCYFAFAYYDKRFRTLSYYAQKAHELMDS